MLPIENHCTWNI